MHRYKIVPPILLILSLVNVVLGAPVVSQDIPKDVIPVSHSEKQSDEPKKRWNEYYYLDEPSWQKRGPSSGSNPTPSVGEPPIDQVSTPNSPPPLLQTGTGSTIQDAGSGPSPEVNKPPPSDGNYPSSGENYHASDQGGPGPSKSYSDSFLKANWVGPNVGGTPDSSKSYPPWNRPELTSNIGPWSTKSYPPWNRPEPVPNIGPWSTKSYQLSDGPETDLEGMPGSSTMSYPLSDQPKGISSTEESFRWNQHDSSSTASPDSSQAWAQPKKTFMSKTKTFFKKLAYKIKFWHRGSPVL